VQELISIVSFIMAVIGALASMFIKERDKQTMASIVGVAFLISFFINVRKDHDLFLKIACAIAFAISVLGGIVAIFSNEESKRSGAIVAGLVSLGTSLLILFLYLEFNLF
jgi:uncharacterized membrane protein